MEHANQDLRDMAKDAKVPAWKIAEQLGIKTSSYFNALNSTVSEERHKQIKEIITKLSK